MLSLQRNAICYVSFHLASRFTTEIYKNSTASVGLRSPDPCRSVAPGLQCGLSASRPPDLPLHLILDPISAYATNAMSRLSSNFHPWFQAEARSRLTCIQFQTAQYRHRTAPVVDKLYVVSITYPTSHKTERKISKLKPWQLHRWEHQHQANAASWVSSELVWFHVSEKLGPVGFLCKMWFFVLMSCYGHKLSKETGVQFFLPFTPYGQPLKFGTFLDQIRIHFHRGWAHFHTLWDILLLFY